MALILGDVAGVFYHVGDRGRHSHALVPGEPCVVLRQKKTLFAQLRVVPRAREVHEMVNASLEPRAKISHGVPVRRDFESGGMCTVHDWFG